MEHQPGLVLIRFKVVRIVLLVTGIVLVILKVLYGVLDLNNFPNALFYLGIGCVIVGGYLLIVKPK